ncbi:hypothetical protein Vadar_024811 [Vaccinium darrowii]|uniref:Uncharacterized protein n=1 Tax=Vaccinium darrowii TaxID=229202 RepID=A0ACB7YQJ8_9ERIC|nr:hypothetical protein Vadar_024811 [Vaccinium darrowii]
MSGFMQTSFFFGYMACICYGFFLMLGAVCRFPRLFVLCPHATYAALSSASSNLDYRASWFNRMSSSCLPRFPGAVGHASSTKVVCRSLIKVDM